MWNPIVETDLIPGSKNPRFEDLQRTFHVFRADSLRMICGAYCDSWVSWALNFWLSALRGGHSAGDEVSTNDEFRH
jgi:hypothetical protein